MKLSITINLPDGQEYPDIPVEAEHLIAVPFAIQKVLNEREIKDGEWSSLVVVIIP